VDTTAVATCCQIRLRHASPVDSPLIRVLIAADHLSGIAQNSYVMVDKVTTVRRAKLGQRTASDHRCPDGPHRTGAVGVSPSRGLSGERSSTEATTSPFPAQPR
jgi:hypothetical protein